MATILDALIVQLNLDPKNFTAEQKKAAESLKDFDKQAGASGQKQGAINQTQRKAGIEEGKRRDKALSEEQQRAKKTADLARETAKTERTEAKKRAEALNTVKEAALGFGAALAAIAVEKFVLGTATTIAAAGRLAHNLDLPTQKLEAFGMAVSQSIGGSTQDAIASLKGLSDAMVKLNTGQDKGILTLFQQLAFYDPKHQQFDTVGPDGKPLDPLAMMDQLAERGARTDPKLFSNALEQAGFSPEVISYLEKGPAFTQKAFAAAYAQAPTDANAAAEQKLIAATNLLEQRFNRISQLLVLKIAPDLIRFMADANSLMKFIGRQISWSEFLKERSQHKADAVAEAAGVADAEGRGAAVAPTSDAPATTPGDGRSGWLYRNLGIRLHRNGDTSTAPPSDDADVPPDKRGFWQRFEQTLGFGRGVPKPGMLPKDIESEVRANARKYGLDPEKMVGLFRAEGGGYDRISPAGAIGPGQLMPGTARELGVADSPRALNYSWQSNTDAAERYFGKLLKIFNGDYQKAQAAYNAGPQRIKDFIAGKKTLPNETRRYVASIASATAPGAAYANGRSGGGAGDVTHNSSVESNVGTVNVYTDSKHAPGIVGAIRGELSKGLLVPKANTGLS